jgi:hypothetical protein
MSGRRKKKLPSRENVVLGYVKRGLEEGLLEEQTIQIQEYCKNKNIKLDGICHFNGRDELLELLKHIIKGDRIIILDLYLLSSIEFANIMEECRDKKKQTCVAYLSHIDIDLNDVYIYNTYAISLALKNLQKETGENILPYLSDAFGSTDLATICLSAINSM